MCTDVDIMFEHVKQWNKIQISSTLHNKKTDSTTVRSEAKTFSMCFPGESPYNWVGSTRLGTTRTNNRGFDRHLSPSRSAPSLHRLTPAFPDQRRQVSWSKSTTVWWFRKSGNHQLRLVVYLIIYKVLYVQRGCLGCLPSTTSTPANCHVCLMFDNYIWQLGNGSYLPVI